MTKGGSKLSAHDVVTLLLVAVTLVIYLPVIGHDFVDYDDDVFVTANTHVRGGLTWSNIVWAFTTYDAAIWHPLTWLSHLVDVFFFDLKPGGHHLTSLVFHLANTLLMFAVWRRMTGALWPAALVAALFAWHPLHVESVAWISERKDVLSCFFWLLAMWAYVDYTQAPGWRRYTIVLLLFACGLMSKTMVVTLPCALLLLDCWPLGRWIRPGPGEAVAWAPALRRLGWLALEKVPFFLLTLAASFIAVAGQKKVGTILSLETMTIPRRLANATVSYGEYLRKLALPNDLAAFYPLPGSIPTAVVAGAVLFLTTVTLLVIWQWRRRPFLAVGWFWYLGTLVPVIGLVQLGSYAMADRYTYIPMTGIFVMVAWGLAEVAERTPGLVRPIGWMAGTVLAILAAVASVQVAHWRNTHALFDHALKVTTNNFMAHTLVGDSLVAEDRLEEGITHYREALRIASKHPEANNNLANALFTLGRRSEAIPYYERAIALRPGFSEAYSGLGAALGAEGRLDEASSNLVRAIALKPTAALHNNLGNVLRMRQLHRDAAREYRAALVLRPNWELPMSNLAWLLATSPDAEARNGDEAVSLAKQSIRVSGSLAASGLNVLAAAFAEAGQYAEAVKTAEQALALAQKSGQTALEKHLKQSLDLYRAGKPWHEARPPG